RPREFRISSSRTSTAPATSESMASSAEYLACDGDVLAPRLLRHLHRLAQRRLAANAGKLDEHREIDARQHLDVAVVERRDGEIGRRAPEHVGEDDHADARIDALYGVDDVLAAAFDVVVGSDRDRLDAVLR